MKKIKRMQAGGAASSTEKPIGRGMMRRYSKMKEKFPGFAYSATPPTTRDAMKDEIRNAMMARRTARDTARDAERASRMGKHFQSKYERMSSRFPGYKPTLASPVDTRDEYKTFKMGLRDYRKANPDVKPVRPGAMPRPVVPTIPPNQPAMRGGGLARKGVGMALARGGLVKANGCAQRGKTKGKMI